MGASFIKCFKSEPEFTKEELIELKGVNDYNNGLTWLFVVLVIIFAIIAIALAYAPSAKISGATAWLNPGNSMVRY
jgi:preprotein translocase subunit SecG